MPVTPTLQGPRLRLRAVEPGDVEALTAIRAEPGVRVWWGDPRPDDLESPDDAGHPPGPPGHPGDEPGSRGGMYL